MTRRRELERELLGLDEIRGILDAMRNLALLETRKIQRFVAAHRRSVQTLAGALAQVARLHALDAIPAREAVLVLVGSERGFCGEFNETLVRAFEERRPPPGMPVVAVGGRLASRLERASPIVVPGATIAEDVDQVIRDLADRLAALPPGELEVEVLSHVPEAASVARVALSLLPPSTAAARAHTPAAVNIAPRVLLPQLAERYLLARLRALLYASLLAENEQRMRHMDSAIRRLDEQHGELRARSNALRQEEITEEIEVIMLGALPRTTAAP